MTRLSKILSGLLFFLAFSSLSQTEFEISIIGNSQFIQSDVGYNAEGAISYHLTEQIGIGIYGSYALMQSDQFDFDYDVNKAGLQTSYRFNRTINWAVESILGICLIEFDDRIGLEKTAGFGVDLGVRLSFRGLKKLNYGLQVNTTYVKIAPGAIGSVGLFLRYQLK